MPHLSVRDRFNRLADMARPFGLTPVFVEKRRITPSSALQDRMTLHKTLLLCRGCGNKLDPRRFHYVELTMYHAEGFCDGWCQAEGPASLWLWEGSEQWADRCRNGQLEAVRRRERLAGQRID